MGQHSMFLFLPIVAVPYFIFFYLVIKINTIMTITLVEVVDFDPINIAFVTGQ